MSNFKEFSLDNFKFTTWLPFYSYLYSQKNFCMYVFLKYCNGFFMSSHVTKIEIAFLFNIGVRGKNKVAF